MASPSTTRTPGARSATHRPQHRDEVAVDLDGGDPGARLGQRQGERPEAGADLHHPVAGPDAGQPDDAPHRVGVDDEVLPQARRRRQTVRRQQRGGLAGREGHRPDLRSKPGYQVMTTSITPVPRPARSSNTVASRSMIRPAP